MGLRQTVEKVAADLYVHALKVLPPDVKDALARAHTAETAELARQILATILRNVEVAEQTGNIICQDTGTPCYFLQVGAGFPLDGAALVAGIRAGCERATIEHDLRPNIVDPISRVNTGTNVGRRVPVIHFEFIPDDDSLRILIVPKGSGSENQSFLRMLVPAEGLAGVRGFVLESVVAAGANPCPPTVVGVGLGGTFDLCARLAKEAIARPLGSRSPDPELAALEAELLADLNRLGIGPMGLGGDTTSLAVHIETADTHISQLPVAVNIQCWCARRAAAHISSDGQVELSDLRHPTSDIRPTTDDERTAQGRWRGRTKALPLAAARPEAGPGRGRAVASPGPLSGRGR